MVRGISHEWASPIGKPRPRKSIGGGDDDAEVSWPVGVCSHLVVVRFCLPLMPLSAWRRSPATCRCRSKQGKMRYIRKA